MGECNVLGCKRTVSKAGCYDHWRALYERYKPKLVELNDNDILDDVLLQCSIDCT